MPYEKVYTYHLKKTILVLHKLLNVIALRKRMYFDSSNFCFVALQPSFSRELSEDLLLQLKSLGAQFAHLLVEYEPYILITRTPKGPPIYEGLRTFHAKSRPPKLLHEIGEDRPSLIANVQLAKSDVGE